MRNNKRCCRQSQSEMKVSGPEMDLLSIKDPSFLKRLNIKELEQLSKEIRDFLIESFPKPGGT